MSSSTVFWAIEVHSLYVLWSPDESLIVPEFQDNPFNSGARHLQDSQTSIQPNMFVRTR
jgi:hypothetical protein